MKKIFVLIQLYIYSFGMFAQNINIPAFGTNETLDIATWNIENFPKNDATTLVYVKEIINDLQFDIIALQEISDTISLKILVEDLPDYDFFIESDYYGGLAFIYKKEVIQFNSAYEIYTTSQYWSPFPRAPQVLDVNYMGQNFILINNHLKCCGDGNLNVSVSNDEENRRFIASNLLKEYIDTNLDQKNVIVLGDLNDLIEESEPNNVFESIINDEENYLFVDMNIAESPSSNWSYPSWPSHLDHILVTNELFDNFENPISEVKTIKIDQYLSNGLFEYDLNVSDHRPVGLKLKVEGSTSINEFTNLPLLNIFPNPATEQITLTFGKIEKERTIEIYNSFGQIIESMNITPSISEKTIDLSSFLDGLYFVKIMVEGKFVASNKFVVF